MTNRPLYRATCTRSEGWWAVRVEGVTGAHTQARRLDQVEANVREVLSLLLDMPEDSFDIEIDPQLPKAAATVLERTERQRRLAERSAVEAAAASRDAVRLLTAEPLNLTLRDTGALLGVSFQRVAQLAEEAGAGQATKGQSTAKRSRRGQRAPARH